MFQPDKNQWGAITLGFFFTVMAWWIWEGRRYPENNFDSLAGLGRFFIPIGTALCVWYLESQKGKPSS